MTGELEIPRDLALAWGVAAAPQRGPKREMSVERIVEAAVDIADADGLGAVSMAAVAAKLGYTPMSLYRYVSAKDDLLLLMQEEATGTPPPEIDEIDGWRPRLEALFQAQVLIYLRHPWFLDIPINGSPTTPNSAAWMDASLGALDATALSQEERLAVTLLITGHSRWYGTVLAGYANTARTTGASPEEITEREAALFEALIEADAYPWLHAAMAADVFRSTADPFAFGLARILDGVEAYIARLAAGDAADRPRTEWVELDDAGIDEKRYAAAAKAVRDAEKGVRDAQKLLRQARRAAADALAAARAKSTS